MSRISGASVLAAQWFLISVAAGLIIARVYLRLRIMRQRLTLADFTLFLAWLATIATSSVDIFFFKLGVLNPDVTIGFEGVVLGDHDLEMTFKLTWIANITFLPAAYLCKASLLIFYFQITSRVFGFPWMALCFVSGFAVVAFLVSTGVSLFICLPLERQWTIGPDMCSFDAIVTSYFIVWAFHFASDVLIFIVPFLIIRGLQMRRLQRFGVYFTFGLGLVNLTATVARFFVNLANKFGGSITQVELMVAIDITFCLIIACLPGLRPYLRLIQGRSLSSYPTPDGPSNNGSSQRTDKTFRRLPHIQQSRNDVEAGESFQMTPQQRAEAHERAKKPSAAVTERGSTDREDTRKLRIWAFTYLKNAVNLLYLFLGYFSFRLPSRDPRNMTPPVTELNPLTATAAHVQELLQAQALSSVDLVRICLEQIDKNDGFLRAVTSIAPQEWLFQEARRLDGKKSPCLLHHVCPVTETILGAQDVVDTEPALNMSSTWGSLALAGTHPKKNAKVINLLIDAGVIILGKTSMSEWGWFRGENIPSGWCAVSGQGQTPYVLGGFKDGDTPSGHSNPSGSSSGSALTVAAGFAPISIGAESTGSLVMPACRAALYTIKPTIGIVPGDGCLSISLHHDTLGPMAKSARGIADLLDAIVDRDATSVPDGGFAASLTGKWDNIRVGVLDPKDWMFGLPFAQPVEEINSQMMAGWDEAYKLLDKHAAGFKRISLITFAEATANGTKSILDLASTIWPSLRGELISKVKR
ncbi:hypothetical protein ACJ41O_006826 [Fusarium nematophilum]